MIENGATIKQKEGAGGYPITRIETLSNDRFNRDISITGDHSYLIIGNGKFNRSQDR